MKEKATNQLRRAIALFLSLAFLMSMMVWNINLQPPTSKYSADSADSEIYGYLIGGYYVDIYASNSGKYYVYRSSVDSEAHKVAGSESASTWKNRDIWPAVSLQKKNFV